MAGSLSFHVQTILVFKELVGALEYTVAFLHIDLAYANDWGYSY